MPQEDILIFIVALLFGSLSAYVAKTQGRNPLLWFCIGFLFGLFGFLALLFVTVFFPTPAQEESQKPPSLLEAPQTEMESLWFYLDSEHAQFGPIPRSELEKLICEGKLTPTSYVWKEGWPEWKKIQELEEFQKKP